MNKVRHFFHLRRTEVCPLAGAPESEAHLRAKGAVAAAVRSSGGEAEIEWVAPGRTFVADVLAVWNLPSGKVFRVVFEVQVSSQTRHRTFERDAVRDAPADMTVWLLQAVRSDDSGPLAIADWAQWSREVPSILLADDNSRAGWWADHIDGTGPKWSATSLANIVAAIGDGAVFVSGEHPGQCSGWMPKQLGQRRLQQIERRRQREEEDRRAQERHGQNLVAFETRAKMDLDTLMNRLAKAGHRPRKHDGGPMYGYAIIVKAGNRRYAIMPAANQIWSKACRANLQATTVIASDKADQRRLREAKIHAVSASEVPISPPSTTTGGIGTPSDAGVQVPQAKAHRPETDGSPTTQFSELVALTRQQRRLQRSAIETERARTEAARQADANLNRREDHLRGAAERLGLALNVIGVQDGWILAELDGQLLVLTGPPGGSPPETTREQSVVWCDTQAHAQELSEAGWTTITSLSELQGDVDRSG